MIVYHTSDRIVTKPDIRHSRKALDFGPGFYVTSLREQAINYAERFFVRGREAFLNIYRLDEGWRRWHIKTFTSYDEEWLDFVIQNRTLGDNTSFDAVEGGIADDKIFRTVELYLSGDIDKKRALTRLKFEKPNHQICLKSQRLIDRHLRHIRTDKL